MSGASTRNQLTVAKQTASTQLDADQAETVRRLVPGDATKNVKRGTTLSIRYSTNGRQVVKPVTPILLLVDGFAAQEITVQVFDHLLTAINELVTSEEEHLVFDIESDEEEDDGTGALAATTIPAAAVATVGDEAAEGAAAVSPTVSKPTKVVRRTAKPKGGSAASGGKARSSSGTPRGGRGAVPEPVEMEPECLAALTAAGLHGYEPVLRQSRIVSLGYLRMHSIDELEQSLKRVGGKAFTFSAVDRRAWNKMGIGATLPAVAAPGPLPAVEPESTARRRRCTPSARRRTS